MRFAGPLVKEQEKEVLVKLTRRLCRFFPPGLLVPQINALGTYVLAAIANSHFMLSEGTAMVSMSRSTTFSKKAHWNAHRALKSPLADVLRLLLCAGAATEIWQHFSPDIQKLHQPDAFKVTGLTNLQAARHPLGVHVELLYQS